MKSKIKAFLLATNEKDKDIEDSDVKGEDKQSKRMSNYSIVQKLNSSRVSNVLKVFITLVAWAYIEIQIIKEVKEAAEKAVEEARKAKEEEARRKAEEEDARRKAEEEEAKRKAEEEEARRKAEEEEAKRKAEEEAEKKAAKGVLDNFLKSNDCYTKFIDSIKDKTTTTEISVAKEADITKPGEQPIKYKFKGELPQIITEFLGENGTLAENLKRDKNAEEAYLKLVPKRSYKHRGRVQGKRESRDNTDDIYRIFHSIFNPEPLRTSIIEQYAKRYQNIIEKETFAEEHIETINIGAFFLTIAYYLANQEKINTQKDAEESEPEDSSTENIELDNVLNKPQDVSLQTQTMYNFVTGNIDDRRKHIRYLGALKYRHEIDDEDFQNSLTTELRQNFSAWLKEETNKKMVGFLPPFSQSMQEGKHSVLYDRKNSCRDKFIDFLLGYGCYLGELCQYPYFFKGSKRKELIINGENTGIMFYAMPDSVIQGEISASDLDKNLKPIWFRDITNSKGTKKYTKLSMEELHKTTESYRKLFEDKIIKFIEITYQAKESGIYVSFKTNNFEIPPVVLSEKEFKELYTKFPNRALYRGLREDEFKRKAHTLFKKLKEKGISYNITKHNAQAFGPGVYWTEDVNQAKEFGQIIVMGVAINDWERIPSYMLSREAKMFPKMFVMRDNECITIREKAVYIDPIEKSTEEWKKEYEKYDIEVCETQEEIDKWLRCED